MFNTIMEFFRFWDCKPSEEAVEAEYQKLVAKHYKETGVRL